MLSRLSLVTETFPPEVNGVAMTLNRLSANLVDRGIDLQVVHPTPRARYEWGQAVSWDAVNVFGFPIPGYPEAQVGLPSWLKLAQIWRQQRPDVVHVATEGILGLTAALTARAMKIPLVTSFHTNFHEYAKHYRASLIKPLVIQYLKTIHRLAEINLVPDPDLIVDLKGHGFRDCRYFGRGVDTDLFSPEKRSDDLRRQWGVGTDGLVILHVSRVAAEKNIQLVLDNIMTLRESGKQPGVTGVIVGDGPERKRLEEKYPELVFAGMRFDEDLATHYASGDLFCFASETETFGNVILEAMASGCAVLSYDYAAGKQYIRTGENGELVPLGDAQAFSSAMIALAGDKERCKQLGSQARQSALKVPWAQIVDSYINELGALLKP